MLWSFRIFLLLFLPFALAAADHHLLGGGLAATLAAVSPGF